MSAELYLQKDNRMLAQVTIALWSITVGPSYQNFPLYNSSARVIGRLGMDIKVLQQTALQIQAISLACNLGHEAFGRFSVNLHCPAGVTKESKHSPVSETPKWVFPRDDFDVDQKLYLAMETNIEELRNDSMQFRVWRHRRNEDEPLLIGECWIGLSRLLKDDRIGSLQKVLSSTVMKKDVLATLPDSHSHSSDAIMRKEDAKISQHFSEKLWSCGRQIGTISGELLISNIPCISQLISGVNTEEGIQIQSTNFVASKTGNTVVFQKMELPAVMMEISNLVDQLKEFVVRKPGIAIQIRGQEIRNHIDKLNEVILKLSETEKETMTAHVYNSEMALTVAQSIFLDLGEHLLKYADTVAFDVRNYYYDCLIHLIRRGELDLGHMDLIRNKDMNTKDRKTDVAIRYRNFLHKLLICALAKMNIKGIEPKVQKFTETVVAMAYFRIPEFKEMVLSCLKRKSFEPVPEWRGTVWDIEVDVTVHSEFLPMFDWDHYFYQHLQTAEDEKFKLALNEGRWQARLEKRGIAYFRFVTEWATDVKRLFVHKHVPWQDIPGYSIILKSFIMELKDRKVEEYPDAMIRASHAILNNSNLISIFVVIVFHKTNLYNFKQVMESYKLVSGWLTYLHEKKYGLPITFVTALFVTGLKATLMDEIALNVANTISVVYNNYQVFNADIKRKIVGDLILGSEAYRLMFHWSEIVRGIFWDFILFRLQSLGSLPLSPPSEVDSQLLLKSTELTQFMSSLEDDTSEKISHEMLPYTTLSHKEYLTKEKSYHEWLERKTIEWKGITDRVGKYGPFEEFPYPQVKVEGTFEDELERRMDEEW